MEDKRKLARPRWNTGQSLARITGHHCTANRRTSRASRCQCQRVLNHRTSIRLIFWGGKMTELLRVNGASLNDPSGEAGEFWLTGMNLVPKHPNHNRLTKKPPQINSFQASISAAEPAVDPFVPSFDPFFAHPKAKIWECWK